MNPPPPFPVESADARRRTDDEHLRLLSLFHFIGAGFGLLGLGFIALHYTIMSHVFNNPEMWKNAKNATPPPREIFNILIWVYVIVGVWFVVSALLNVLSGLFLRQRQHRMFSLVVGGLNCLHIPIGTALGAFTIIVLSRDSVRDSYRS
jgi:hypothetical protein